MKLFKVIVFVAFVLLVALVFRNWFQSGLISGGDFQIYYKEMFHSLTFFPPPAWNWSVNGGFGANGAALLWNYIAVQIPIVILGHLFGFPWTVIQRFSYLFPLLILLFIAPFFVFRKLFKFPFSLLALLIFGLNTYILMLIGGGQIFLSLAYSLIPLVLYSCYKLFREKNVFTKKIKFVLIFSLILSAQLLLDIRIAYVALTALAILLMLDLLFFNKNYKNILYFCISLVISGLIHFFWILPTLLLRSNPLAAFGEQFTSLGIVNYLSFAKFENTISLLQPNWPENIFGKAYFMRPEFLILPMLAFSALLFIHKAQKEKRELIVFFVIIGLLGAFLAKGTNEPFGALYLFLFERFPGFIMFRDSTKWYPLVAISYTVLVPFTIWNIYEWLKSQPKFQINSKNKILNLQNLFLLLTVFYLVFLIRPAWMGQLTGIFKPTQIPADYIKLEQFLAKDNNFYRTVWFPRSSKYSFYSTMRPLIFASGLTNKYSINKISETFSSVQIQTLLQDISAKYIIVPDDSSGEIFLTDRKYDDKLYETTLNNVSKISYLKRIEGFGKIGVFEVPNVKDHLWSPARNLSLTYRYISPVEYKLMIKNAKKGDLIVFSESYDSKWIAENTQFKIQSSKFDDRFDSFILPQDGDYSLKVYYTPQDYVNIGLVISVGTLIVSLFTLLILLFKKK